MNKAYEYASIREARYALPPPEAWKEPDVWLAPDGLSIRDDAPRFMPVLNKDGVVKPIETVEKVVSLFHPNYAWPINRYDPELKPDAHHFQHSEDKYQPEHHNGSTLPLRFRRLPIFIGEIPRRVHVVLHQVSLESDVPDYDVMQEYCDQYYHFANLHESARNTLDARRMFAVRRADVERNPERLGNRTEDTIGKQVLSLMHARHYSNYSELITRHKELEYAPIIPDYIDYDMLDTNRPQVIHKALRPLGQIASRQTINFLPRLNLRAA